MIAAVFPVHLPPESLPELAVGAEGLGYDGLWMAEDCFLGGAIALAGSALAATRELRVTLGLMPAAVRNPAIAAMEIATLARLYPGRFHPAFGLGVAAWMRQIDALPQPRLVALAEVVQAVRDLLAGREVTASGSHVRLDHVALDQPPQVVPPVLVGTTGPKGIRVAARHADGLLLPPGCGPRFVEWARGQAAEDSGRVALGAWISLDDDPARARSRLEPELDGWLGSGLYPYPLRLAGLDPDGPLPAARDLPAEVVAEVGVAGDAQACARAIERLVDAGVDELALVPVGDEPHAELERIASEVLPLVRSARG